VERLAEAGKMETGPDRALQYRLPMNVFIKCPKCGHQSCLDEIHPNRTGLAMLRGSEEPIRCRNCHANMDTMGAFVGEQVGSEIVRRDDPKW
jgi:DNA-directed RNA polymerase subunit RPC12/RpoP